MTFWHNQVIEMLTFIITLLTQPACLRTECTTDGYKVTVVYEEGITGPTEVGGCFAAVDQARCYCEKNVGGKGTWDESDPTHRINTKPSQIKYCIIDQVGPF